MARKRKEEVIEPIKYPRKILGLDVSTNCIGACIVVDDGNSDKPEIIKLTHISPKVSRKKEGVEALLLRKKIFEETFISTIKDVGITDVIIEEPLISSNNAFTVAALLRFNGMISDSVYEHLGVVPNFISSYDARTYSFPELMSIRKFNKKGEEYPVEHILKAIKKDHLVLFGSYPFDVDKKSIMMNLVNSMYDDIKWVYNEKNGELKKENYDACDSLVCALAYVNINHHGIEKPVISTFEKKGNDTVGHTIDYKVRIWDREYDKRLNLSPA